MRHRTLAIILGFLTLSAHGEEPGVEPILRIETGMHTAKIGRIATDAANRYVVSGSWDKTVRVWELATGRLLQTVRVPIGPGHQGKIFAVGCFDGTPILADAVTGRTIRTCLGGPHYIESLAFAPAYSGKKKGAGARCRPRYRYF